MRVAHSLCQREHLLLHCWVSLWWRSDAKPWVHCRTCLDSALLEAEVNFIPSLCRIQKNCISAVGSVFSYDTRASTVAEAAVPNCSGSRPTVSPFCFQILMTVTSYFQPERFPTHGTTNVRLTWETLFSYISLVFSPLPKVVTSSFKCQLDHHK